MLVLATRFGPLGNSTVRAADILLALVFSAGAANAADHFEMLPSDTDPAIVAPFQILESDIVPPPASEQTIFDGNSSAGSASFETSPNEAMIFRDDATASSASIVNNGGQTLFEDRATAASSTLTTNEDGYLRFSGTSDAADSRAVINDGGRLDFTANASAGSAFITNNAHLRFGDYSSASNSEITVNEDGVLAFRGSSDAGIARIANSGLTGFFDYSTLAGSTFINNGTGFLLFADDANAGTTSFIGNSGTVVFAGKSTLNGGAITNNATGILRFEDTATAGTGFISSSGGVVFTDKSSAANSDIVGNLGGLILFRDDSSAGNATISGSSNLRFAGRSSAATASITMAPDTTLSFIESARGDAAIIQLDTGALLDISLARTQVSVASLSGAGDVSLGANTLILGDGTPLLNFAGNIEDNGLEGGLIKRGAGTVNLSGNGIYSGPTLVSAGTLEAGAQNAFSSQSAFTIGYGATLALAGFDQEVGSLAGAGSVDLSAGSVLTAGGNNRSTTFSGQLTGSGDIKKVGSGQLTLTGVSSLSGNTIVEEGRLRVDGDISSSSVTVGQNAALLGDGSVGTTNISGKLRGGAEGAGIDVIGDLTLSGMATTELDISGTYTSQFKVSGTATLGGTLTMSPSSSVIPDRQYVFLTAGLVVGAYDSLESNFAFLDPVVTYGGNFAALEFLRNAVSFSSVGDTPNQRATATAIESLDAGNAVYDAIVVLPAADARAAFDNLSGEAHATALVAVSTGQSDMRRAVLAQIDDETRANVWSIALSGSSRLAYDGNGAGSDTQSSSFIAGADIFSDRELQLGLFGYLGKSELAVAERASSGENLNTGAGLYGSWTRDNWQTRGLLALAHNSFDLTRNISLGTLSGTARSAYLGWTAAAAAEVGYLLATEPYRIEPYAGLDYSYLSTSGFGEHGGFDADLSSNGSSYSQLNTEIGIRASTALFQRSDLTIRPSVGLSYIRNVAGAAATSTHRFAQGDEFEVSSAHTAQDSLSIDLRINLAFSNGAEGDLFYRGALQDSEYNQLLGAAFKLSF